MTSFDDWVAARNAAETPGETELRKRLAADLAQRMAAPSQELHQERELKSSPCGCRAIWSRGRWCPKLTCWEHWADDLPT